MSGEEMKRLAMQLVAGAGQGNIAEVAALIADDFVLEQMVRQPDGDYSAAGTRYDRASYLGFLGAVKEMTRSGMNLAFELALADGDNVALFGTSDAVSPGGKIYRNAYCWRLKFSGGKICLMREYYDTALGNWLMAG